MMMDEKTLMSLSVNDVIQRYPAVVAVFSRYGIDSCCGGALPVAEAASRHKIDPVVLRDALMQAVSQAA